MQTNILDFKSWIPSLQTNYPIVYSLLVTIVYAIIIFIAVLIIRRIFHLFRSKSPNLIDGLLIIINFSALVIWVAVSAPLFKVNQSYILGGSALGVALIGLSASYLGANFMGGLFIIITRPFGVGDIIYYNGTVGLVTEIGLNYTRLLKLNKTELTICNSNIVNALIHNSSVFVKPQKKNNQVEIDLVEEGSDKEIKKGATISFTNKAMLKFNPNKLTHTLTDSLNIKKIVRLSYTFDIRQDMPNLDVSIKAYEQRLQNLCTEFEDVFGFQPEFFFNDNYWRISTTIVITAVNARVLFNNYSNFLEGIIRNAYSINVGGTA